MQAKVMGQSSWSREEIVPFRLKVTVKLENVYAVDQH